MSDTSEFDEHRRCARAIARVPVHLRGTATNGTPMEEEAHTGIVGVLGAMIRTSGVLQLGSEVAVTNLSSRQTAMFRVVWVRDDQVDNLWEIGIESLQPSDDFWGVPFPPTSDAR